MAKKKLRKLKTSENPQIKNENGSDSRNYPEERQDKTDFGGLPNIDLKKNLGCG